MALKIKQSDTFAWPVKVNIPKDGGGYEVCTFDAVFKRLPRSEAEALGAAVASGELGGIEATKRILVGWSGVTDGDTDAPFSETNRDALLEIQGVGLAIFRVFTEANSGAAQLKN